jgi:hypothetical protein
MVRCGAQLHTVGSASLARNVRWFQKQSWLDDRLRPLFDIALQSLESAPAAVANDAKKG